MRGLDSGVQTSAVFWVDFLEQAENGVNLALLRLQNCLVGMGAMQKLQNSWVGMRELLKLHKCWIRMSELLGLQNSWIRMRVLLKPQNCRISMPAVPGTNGGYANAVRKTDRRLGTYAVRVSFFRQKAKMANYA